MIDRLEAWLEHTPITGKRCGKGMYLPIIVLRSRTARSIGRLTGGRQPVTATPGARCPMRRVFITK